MRKEKLTQTSNEQLLDWLVMPNCLALVEEEVLVLAELATRHLTIHQRLLIRRKMTASRRQYNYACCNTAN